jgi:hypothetical protein
MQKYQQVTLSADLLFILVKIPFLMTISRYIKFGTAGKLDIQDDKTILKHVRRAVVAVYTTRGFKVTIMLGDGQFESMRGEIADMGVLLNLNVVSEGEQVPEIELFNRTIKGRVRCTYNMHPSLSTSIHCGNGVCRCVLA